MVDDNQNQSAAATIDREGIGILASEKGSLYFDVLLPASVPHGSPRQHIRDCFKSTVLWLAGLSAGQKDKLIDLAKYMYKGITETDERMPSEASKMLELLNRTYIQAIAAHLSKQPGITPRIGAYMASQDQEASDIYCIGPDGRRYCYHFFELAGPDPILLPEGAKFRMCCVAPFD